MLGKPSKAKEVNIVPKRDMFCIRCNKFTRVDAPAWALLPVGICRRCSYDGPPAKADWERIKDLRAGLTPVQEVKPCATSG